MNDHVSPIVPAVWEAAIVGAGAVSLLLFVAALLLVVRTRSFSPGVRIALALLAFAAPVAGPIVGIVLALLERRRARHLITVSP